MLSMHNIHAFKIRNDYAIATTGFMAPYHFTTASLLASFTEKFQKNFFQV